MTKHRGGHTATLLTTGKILVAGGTAGFGLPNEASEFAAEIFDPAGNGGVGTFVATGDMRPHSSHAAAPLSGGRALVCGGGSGGSAACDVYEP
jgi:hypothetical protein